MSKKTHRPRGQSGNPAVRGEMRQVTRELEAVRRMSQGEPLSTPSSMPGPVPNGIPVDQVAAGLQQSLNELVQQNIAELQQLAQRGIGFNETQLANARIDTVIDSIVQALGPQGVLWGLQCRILFEQRMAENIEKAKTEGTRAMLAQAGSFSPEAIREMARQTGTFGGR